MSEPIIYHSDQPLLLESGKRFEGIDICYSTWGTMNPEKDNVVWVCHAFTANSDAECWWPGMIGPGCLWDPSQYFIICANILGSCYGTTGPHSINPATDKPWYLDFPLLTVRDLVKAHLVLAKHLGIEKINTIVGGSVGAQQAMEWAIMEPGMIERLIVIAANAVYTPWGIAFNEAQRLALQADTTFTDRHPDAGRKGLKAARSIAMLSYRNQRIFDQTQREDDAEKTDDFKASGYQQYQGDKLVNRFNAHSYYFLSKILDSHNCGRGRGGVEKALEGIRAKTLVIGIASDLLFPPAEQRFIAENVPCGVYAEIESLYGHDGFLIEIEQQTRIIREFYDSVISGRTPF
jgi:homoserine O-acetyltransferase/O-succinyltransferase